MSISVLKRIINIIVWVAISLYLFLVILLHLPYIQGIIGSWTADALSKKFGTTVSIGQIDLGFVNRLIVDDICIFDQNRKKMLKVSRASIKINIIPLIENRVSISSIQFFGMEANLYKKNNKTKTNYQFLIDSLSNKKNNDNKSIDLQINSIIIRHGAIRYRCLSEVNKKNSFSLNNINIKNISGHIILDKFSNDSINIKVKKLSLEEHSGIKLKKLSFKVAANKTHLALNTFNLELPSSRVHIDSIDASYTLKDGSIYFPALKFRGNISDSYITPSDFSFYFPKMKGFKYKILCRADIYGVGKSIYINNLLINESTNLFNLSSTIRVNKHFSSWYIDRFIFKTNSDNIKTICKKFPDIKIPKMISKLGNIKIVGKSQYRNHNKEISFSGCINTDIGTTNISLIRNKNTTNGKITTKNLNIRELTDDTKFGVVNTQLYFNSSQTSQIKFNGTISSIDYNQYTYHALKLNGIYENDKITGKVEINDPNAKIKLTGNASCRKGYNICYLNADIKHLSPSALHLSDKWPYTRFNLNLTAHIEGNNISNATGQIRISDFSMVSPQVIYKIDSLSLNVDKTDKYKNIIVTSDFGNIFMYGDINYSTIPHSIIGLIHSKLPTIPLYTNIKTKRNNDFKIEANINDSKWINFLLGIPIELQAPITINGEICDKKNELQLDCQIPSFIYDNKKYKDVRLRVNTIDGILKTSVMVKKISDKGNILSLGIKASAVNNELDTEININENEKHPLQGKINANTFFYNNVEGKATANINIKESDILIDDTVWHIKPSNIIYNKNYIEINNFSVEHDKQYISIAGKTTKELSDSICMDFKDININYILDMVDFHSVEFDGLASGKAYIKGISGKKPEIYTDLIVKDFLFEKGRMGTLYAKAQYNNIEEKIDINAIAKDKSDSKTIIIGYISPKQNFIDLDLTAHNTRIEFMESFCSSFMKDVNAYTNGTVKLSGPLNNINMTGMLIVDGTLGISSLNTYYTLSNDTIRFIPNEIEFENDSIFDSNGNYGLIEGGVHHKHLTNLSYDLSIKANNLLSFNTNGNNGDSFYGTVYATGNCKIKGRSGEVTMDINVTPEKNSTIVYDVSSMNNISTNEFIQWKSSSRDNIKSIVDTYDTVKDTVENIQTTSDMRLNFLIDCNPNINIKILMDKQSGDHIALNGNGTLRATYYNKGTFDMFGNYIVDHGIYKLTIRDIIKKEFTFKKGGTIKFVGDPFNASLDLNAIYVLNGVSLSDLNIGNSFSNNNVRVNCLMNITGTPNNPKVSFDIDMPTLSNDAKQMVSSVINAEEEMNQQVLYLLTVGRFYNQNSNNNSTSEGTTYSQASLAMQSILSGTISQQLNNILGNIINSNDWNFGANISTGTEGFNDAEYEGILSGKLLNNRLLINGQFGYRDNANATTSFIGDFDLRYLLFPNGNLSINVYNKTNDRYFTKNSLNTQGIGIIMKKDFNGIRDLFKKRRKK